MKKIYINYYKIFLFHFSHEINIGLNRIIYYAIFLFKNVFQYKRFYLYTLIFTLQIREYDLFMFLL